ncbi:mechanosensitive ion channel family protein [Ruminococcus sp.]|uniref:mechanosensitive ion channel family protein n=2 Tax=Ruminococcus sp. TaxID=41978 RepID=UPI0025F507D6|nr:mechanosensitive ion channel domain-containing protein [Ruminococcus sp.]MCI5816476.1 mechanosensitive ion channel [Ruminococcus sp.]MDD7555997.1 mechanosensitive ion channel [Ruminococcus sp.]MDY4964693.1 mechanosensitive ion channel [Ruminococcus callidus]
MRAMEIDKTIDETEAVVEQTTSFFSGIIHKIQDAIPTLLVAVVVFFIGVLLAKLLQKMIKRGMRRSNIDETAIGFFQSLIRVILYTVLIVICLSILNVPMSSIVAVIGAAGLAIGLALQNSLSNLAGGFIILFSKPFKAGDFIETSGVSGTVESVGILYTRIITVDNKTIYIPNGTVSGSVISNYTEKKLRRLDLEFSISYASDFDKARSLILQAIQAEEIALKEPAPLVRMGRQDDSAVVVFTYVWVDSSNYWELRYTLLENVKKQFDANGISIPFPQVDVHNIQQ